jgi:hypothetical protein
MHLALAISVSAPFFSYASVHIRQVQAMRGLFPFPSFSSSSSSRQLRPWKAPSMKIEQRDKFKVDCF